VRIELNPDSVVPMWIGATSSTGGSVRNVEWPGAMPSSARRTSQSVFWDCGWDVGSYQCSGEAVIGTHGPFPTSNGPIHIEAAGYWALFRRDAHDVSIDVPFGPTSGYNALMAFAIGKGRPWAVFSFLNMKHRDYGWLSVVNLDEVAQLIAAGSPRRSQLEERCLFPSGAEVETWGLEPCSGPRVDSVSFSADGLWLAACLHEHVMIYEVSDWPMYGHRLRDCKYSVNQGVAGPG